MNKLKSTMRIAALAALSFAGFFGVLCEPVEGSQAGVASLILSKALGFAALCAVCSLYRRWAKTDPWIKAFEHSCSKGLDRPNPMKID